MQFIDTHAHLNLSAFSSDIEAVVQRCAQEQVAVINVGTKESISARAVELALAHSQLYAIVGLHPIQTVPQVHDEAELGVGGQPFISKGEVFNTDFYRHLVQQSNGLVVGIGECGFDYWHCGPNTYEIQEAAFLAQIALANELKLPLMIHTRGPKPGETSPTGRSVYVDVYEILKRHATVPFNVHFYAGTYEEAVAFIDIGGTVSFTGVLTFAKQYESLVASLPFDKIHAETDCPFVAPKPYRGQRCEPWMVTEVYEAIASIKAVPVATVQEQLLKNAQLLYGIQN